MAGINSIVTRGFGSWGSVTDVVTRGYGISTTVIVAGPFVSERCHAWAPDAFRAGAAWSTDRNARVWTLEGTKVASGRC